MRSGRERAVDADAARRWLQQQSYVAPDRVSLIGWGNGAVAALWTVRPRTAKKGETPDFRSAVAFYPGCRRLRDTAWSTRLPTLILIGAKDDWSPASACEQMVAGARGRTAQASLTVYPAPIKTLITRICRCSSATALRSRAASSGACMSGPIRLPARMRSSA
jgi:dienelactone hydrolase